MAPARRGDRPRRSRDRHARSKNREFHFAEQRAFAREHGTFAREQGSFCAIPGAFPIRRPISFRQSRANSPQPSAPRKAPSPSPTPTQEYAQIHPVLISRRSFRRSMPDAQRGGAFTGRVRSLDSRTPRNPVRAGASVQLRTRARRPIPPFPPRARRPRQPRGPSIRRGRPGPEAPRGRRRWCRRET